MGSSQSHTPTCISFYCSTESKNSQMVCYIYDTTKEKEALSGWYAGCTSHPNITHKRLYYYACKECYNFIPQEYKKKFIFVDNYQEYLLISKDPQNSQ